MRLLPSVMDSSDTLVMTRPLLMYVVRPPAISDMASVDMKVGIRKRALAMPLIRPSPVAAPMPARLGIGSA